jgi:hypothetical protein
LITTHLAFDAAARDSGRGGAAAGALDADACGKPQAELTLHLSPPQVKRQLRPTSK